MPYPATPKYRRYPVGGFLVAGQGQKKFRNPRTVTAFRRIGLSEQAGTGIRVIFGTGNSVPIPRSHIPQPSDQPRGRESRS